ncbi:hypothetical protein J2W57_001786 [Chryseobacterium ginsenosidimutans]|uniref:Uncharacterized protein n=1 Tax=Chryseobacterium geocarposphaerae TaxID=1416776 RepID=A0ABU1LBG1_9FLAO|nr:hypothetical protein [Chryseobacterium geocarposphaerae]MDR6698414.1 hypothetical protein [Chryseobacterium ginsenosidimutans]
MKNMILFDMLYRMKIRWLYYSSTKLLFTLSLNVDPVSWL